MYLPSDDSIFLSDTLSRYHGHLALEIGTGSGIIMKELSRRFRTVIGTDIDFNSLRHLSDALNNARLVCCDAASAFHDVRFDLIVTNPPYLPNDPSYDDNTIDGGSTGIEISVHILTSALDYLSIYGKILILVSNLSNKKKLERFISKNNLVVKEVAQKNLFYESLQILEISR